MATGSLEVRQKIMTNFNFSHIHKISAQSDDWIFRYIFLKIVNGDFWGPFFTCCLFQNLLPKRDAAKKGAAK